MGPSSEVTTKDPVTDDRLPAIDALLSSIAGTVARTKKGRNWTVLIKARPFYLTVATPNSITLTAGLNASQDTETLRHLAQKLAALLHGTASEPAK